MGRKRKNRGACIGAPTRRKGKVAEPRQLDDSNSTLDQTGSETAPNLSMDEPQVECVIKVELEPEEGPSADVNNRQEGELHYFNEVFAEVDIGLVEVKVLHYPDEDLVLQVEDERGPDSNTTNESRMTNRDPDAGGHLRTVASSSKSSEHQVGTTQLENLESHLASWKDEDIERDRRVPEEDQSESEAVDLHLSRSNCQSLVLNEKGTMTSPAVTDDCFPDLEVLPGNDDHLEIIDHPGHRMINDAENSQPMKQLRTRSETKGQEIRDDNSVAGITDASSSSPPKSGNKQKLRTRLTKHQSNAKSDDVADKTLKGDKYNDNIAKEDKKGNYVVRKIQSKSWAKVGTPISSINPKTGRHKCGTCSMEFTKNNGFKRHFDKAHLKVRFKCVTCGKQYVNKSNCERHQATVHVGVRYACQVCSKTFTGKERALTHQRTTDCEKKLSSGKYPLNLQKVIDKEPQKKPLPTSVKLIEGKPRAKLETPMSIMNPETGKHTCCICSKEFPHKSRVKPHYEKVHLRVRFKCVTCGKQFFNRGDCNRHQQSTHAGVRYTCQVCNKTFTQAGGVRVHQLLTICGKKKLDMTSPKAGQDLHTTGITESTNVDEGVSPLANPQRKAMREYDDANSTMDNNNQESERAKSSSYVEAPVSSMNQKTGKHKCGTCSREFSSKRGFKLHFESVHLNIRFDCVTCGKHFSKKGDRNLHQQSVHLGVRHACEICNKSYTQAGDVRQHQRRSDCGKKLGLKLAPRPTCPHCGKTFSRNRNLQVHLKTIHQKLQPIC